jgi:uncharacterized protein (DUF427 family)
MHATLTPPRPGHAVAIYAPPVAPTQRRVRVKFGSEIVADSKRALFLRQYTPGHFPTYYFPAADVRMDLLEPCTATGDTDDVRYWTLNANGRVAQQAAWMMLALPPELAALEGHLSFAWDQMDGWYEEAEEIFVHARDPYHRVDVLASDRHVRVVIAGETVAESHQPFLLFETSLPTRYYLPRADVRMDRLEPTSLHTHCPFKGIASYWSVNTGNSQVANIAWSYENPIAENPKIKDLICFFNEHVDLYVDGELQIRPQTPWS